MNFIICAIKLNRFFRRAMSRHYQDFPVESVLSDDEMDDIDNMYAGCAFE